MYSLAEPYSVDPTAMIYRFIRGGTEMVMVSRFMIICDCHNCLTPKLAVTVADMAVSLVFPVRHCPTSVPSVRWDM